MNQENVGSTAVQSLVRMSHLLQGTTTDDHVYEQILQILLEAASAAHGCLVVERDGRLTVEAALGMAEVSVHQGSTLTAAAPWIVDAVEQARSTQEPLQFHSKHQPPDAHLQATQPPATILCLPLVQHTISVGVVYIESPDPQSSWSSTIDELLILATMAASKLDRIQLEVRNRTLEQHVAQQAADLALATRQTHAAEASAEQASNVKSRFLASISHDLRTPINAIINFADFLERYGELSERQRQLQRRIMANAEQLLTLFNDAVDLTKLEAGRMDLQCEPAAIMPILESAMTTTAGLVKEADARLQLDVAADVPPAWIDKRRIRQVLLNLLTYAVKHSDGETISINVSRSEDAQVRVAVHGAGAIPDDQMAIFHEQPEDHNAVARHIGDIGLGLPLSKRLIELHGGQLWAEQTPTGNTVFHLSLRAAQTVPAQPTTAIQDGEDVPIDVVVVHHNPAVLEELHALLRDEGYHVLSVQHDQQVIPTIQQTRPRLIILDIALPDIDGWNMLAMIRDTPDIAAIPVLMYTDQHGSSGVFIDACAHLVKPIPEEALLAVVGQWAPPPATIVVIDDDPDAREIMRTILTDAGYLAILATDGISGLAAVHGAKPNLVLLDLMMPQMDGFAVLEAIRSSGKHELPVVVVSALELEQSEWHWLRTRTQAHLARSEGASPSLLTHVRRLLGTADVT